MNIKYIILFIMGAFLFSGYKQGAIKTYKVKIDYTITMPDSSKMELQINDKHYKRTLKTGFDTSFKAVTGDHLILKGTCRPSSGKDEINVVLTETNGNNPRNMILKPSPSNDYTVSLDLILP